MRDSRRAVAAVLALALLLVTAGAIATSAFAGDAGPIVLSAGRMTGDQEVPGPGDPDAIGRSRITLYTDLDIVCWRTQVAHLDLPGTASHIHEGEAGVGGGIVVTLAAPDTSGKSQGCTLTDPDIMAAIIANPAGYYVNVHNTPYLGGAVRGQLSG
jgi:hypothetical protein